MSVTLNQPLSPSGPGWRSQAAIALVVVAGGALIGGLSAGVSPAAAAGVTMALLLGALMARAPTAVFGACLLALAYSPEYLGPAAGVFAHPQLQKGLLYFVIIGFMLRRGVQPLALLVLAAYAAEAVLAELDGQLIAGLSTGQMAASFVTLTVGWAALSIRWRYDTDVRFLRMVAGLPVACVIFGLLLQAAGIHSFWQSGTGFDTTTRLAGASIPAQLALTAFGACFAAQLCYRLARWRPAVVLMVADAVILALTVSRGAALALGIAMAYPALRFAFSRRPEIRTPQWLRIGALAALIGIAAAFAIPALLSRASTGVYFQGEGVITNSTSGRSAAWHQFYAIAKQSPLFGHGLGAGPITHIAQQGFENQHNEFLRLFLEGGYIGGGLVMLAMVIVIGTSIARSPPMVRLDLLGFIAGFATLSYTDNTLSSPNLAVPLCLILGICASWSYAPQRERRQAQARITQLEPVPVDY